MKYSSIQLLSSACVFATAGMMASPAHAVLVTITSGADTGLVVFDSAGFENDLTDGSNPSSANAVGSYSFPGNAGISVETGDISSSFTNPSSGGPSAPTGAYEGNNYLVLDRLNQTGSSRIAMLLEQTIDPATTSFRLEYALWGFETISSFSVGAAGAESTSGNAADVLSAWGEHRDADDSNPQAQAFTRFGDSSAGGVVRLEEIASPVTFNAGEWNTIVYEWDHTSSGNASLGGGPGEGFLTVNGTTVSVGRHSPAGDTDGTLIPTAVGEFFGGANGGSSAVFIDSVPEPGSLALLGAGGLMMLTRGRRRD